MGTPALYLYLDDSGARLSDKKPPDRRDGLDWFALGGIVVKSEDVTAITDAHAAFCKAHGITYPLHSNSIRCKKDNFRWMESEPERAEEFMAALGQFVCSLPIIGHACVIHRPGYDNRYKERYGSNRWELCKSAYTIVVERAAKFARRHGRRLLVYVEASGPKEDKALKQYQNNMRTEGMYFNKDTSAKYAPLAGNELVGVLSKNPRFTKKENPLTQLADVVLFPIVKGRYESTYRPYCEMSDARLLIDQHLPDEAVEAEGVKYYCFDGL